jgi:hypothetical protein
MSDDLLYRSVCRLKKMVELNAPSGVILREAAMTMKFAVERAHYQEEYAERCVEQAIERKASDEETESK